MTSAAFEVLQDVRRRDIRHVERRILAHQDHVQIVQTCVDFGFQLEPFGRVSEDFQGFHAGAGLACALIKILLLHIEQRPATFLGGKQHGQ